MRDTTRRCAAGYRVAPDHAVTGPPRGRIVHSVGSPGFLTPAAAPAPLALVARVLHRKAVPGAVISHMSAAELLALPLPYDEEYEQSRTVHGAVLLEERRRSGRGAVMHTRSEGPTLRVEGLRISAPVALLGELAGTLDHAQLVALL